MRIRQCKRAFSLFSVVLLIGVASQANALVITRNFVNIGGAPIATDVAGGGNLTSIFNAAADWWEASILDPFALTINFDWGPLNDLTGTLGLHTLLTQSGGRETSAQIIFDNLNIAGGGGAFAWFMDATPFDDSEYSTFTTFTQDLGSGLQTNIGREYTGASGAAVGNFDLFSVALHEIGHALGLSSANTAYQLEAWPDNDVDAGLNSILTNNFGICANVNATTPGNCAAAVFGSNAHLNNPAYPNALMFPSVNTGTRNYASAADIMANCQISQFTNCVLDPALAVPEPGTVGLLGAGLLGTCFRKA